MFSGICHLSADWLIPAVIPFTVPTKDEAILKIDKQPLHEQAPAAGQKTA